MIVGPGDANEIIASGMADMVALARAFLDNPRWLWHAADVLGGTAACPLQYLLGQAGKMAGGGPSPRARTVATA